MSAASGGTLRGLLEARIAEGWMPGATWWVEGPAGRVLSRGAAGRAVVEPSPEPTREDVPYDLGSLTKPLATAVLALLAEREERIDLDVPLARLLPELGGGPHGERSAADLATHRAGLPAWRPLYLAAGDPAGFLAAIAAEPPGASAPGESRYSDLGYMLLGIAVERAFGEPLDRLFERRVAYPLGLPRAGFAVPPRSFTDAAPTERGNRYEREMAGDAGSKFAWRREGIRGEVHDGNAWALGGVAGHAGLFGTAAEVAAIAREWLVPGALGLTAGERRRLLEPEPAGGERTFGLVLAGASSAARGALPDDAPGHTGFCGTSVWVEPARERIYVLLTNRVHPEVQARGLQPVRREFHRLAASL